MDIANSRYKQLSNAYSQIGKNTMLKEPITVDNTDVTRLKIAMAAIEHDKYKRIAAEDMLLASKLTAEACGSFWDSNVGSLEISPNVPDSLAKLYRDESTLVGMITALKRKVQASESVTDRVIAEYVNMRAHNFQNTMAAMSIVGSLEAQSNSVVRLLEKRLREV